MSQTIEARQSNPEQSEKMAKLETADNDIYGYLSRKVADAVGEYMTITVTDDSDATQATKQKSTKNFGVYETPGGAVVGLGVSKSILNEVFGESEEVPDSIGLEFDVSTKDDYEASEEVDEEEVDALLAGVGGSDSDGSDASDESDDSEDEEVEISDEELGLVSE